MNTLTLHRHNSFQNQNNKKATHSFAPRRLVFKLQQEGLKFNNIFVSWSFQTKQGDKFFKPRNPKFRERQFFSSIVTYK